MKAAKRIRDYLYVLKRDTPARSRISAIPGVEPLTVADLEAVLDSRESWRQAARTQTEEMLRDLHLALWPDEPVHLHDFSYILTTIRNRQAGPLQALSQERAERARLASQLAAAENEAADLKEQLLAERNRPPLTVQMRDVSVERERDKAQRKLQEQQIVNQEFEKMLEDTFAAIKNLYAELGGDPDKLPVNNGPQMLSYLGTRISHSQDINVEPDRRELRALQGKIRDTYYGYFGYPQDNSRNEHNAQAMLQILADNLKRLGGSALHEQVQDLQRILRKEREGYAQLDAELAAERSERIRTANELRAARSQLSESSIAARVNQALTGVQTKLRDTLIERDQAQEKLAQIARLATPEDLPF